MLLYSTSEVCKIQIAFFFSTSCRKTERNLSFFEKKIMTRAKIGLFFRLFLKKTIFTCLKKRDYKSTFFLHNVVVEKITISTINNNWLHTGYETFPFPGYIGKVPVMYWRTCYRPISI